MAAKQDERSNLISGVVLQYLNTSHYARAIPTSLVRAMAKAYGCDLEFVTADRFQLRHPNFIVEGHTSFIKRLILSAYSPKAEKIIGEGYMHGEWWVKKGKLEDFLSFLWNAVNNGALKPWARHLLNAYRFYKRQRNTPDISKKNIAYHYDNQNKDNALFETLLGDVKFYSSAYFDENHKTLGSAQYNKLERILNLLNVKKEMEVLDIGAGWGALTRALADKGCHATGLTISKQQYDWCIAHKQNTRNTGAERYFLKDYREFFHFNNIKYDRITCIEVLDHIGTHQYNEFFQLAHQNLKPNGTFLLQLILRPHKGQTSTFIDTYIYPGGYIASYAEVEAAFSKAGFRTLYKEDWSGYHYAQTLREWRALLLRNKEAIQEKLDADDVFFRKWLFFLAYSISAFENAGFYNAHLLLKKEG